MGKLRKRFNWKAQQVVKNDETKNDAKDEQIQLDLDIQTKGCDSCNVLVLPSKKRKINKIIVTEKPYQRPLSKKQQKKLEKVLEAKKKKSNRSQLLEELQKVQATPEELALMESTVFMQTKGLKRTFSESENDAKFQNDIEMNSIKGSKPFIEKHKRERMEDANVVGLDISSSSGEGSDVEDIINKGNIKRKQDQLKNESLIENITPVLTDNLYKQSKSNELSKTVQSSQELLEGKQMKGPKKETCVSSTSKNKPATYVILNRSSEIQAARLALPILSEEQVIMEAINESPVVIICGETGSGKTTQVPQFLYEGGYARKGLIGITEPRRVAAISMSQRVGLEMNLSSREVSYQIRFEGNVTESTKIKFMTDGVLLKEIQKDFLLVCYSVIIIDEAHERSVYSDILIGLLSRIVPLREKRKNPLKLVIMSATLRVEDFTENSMLFKKPPPVIKVESRQFPVTVHFNKRTPVEDYLGDAYRKICKIHRQLPEGGILVFVTGQQEIRSLCRKLKRTFPYAKKQQSKTSATNFNTKEKYIHDSGGEWDDVKSFKQMFKGGEKKRMQKKGRKCELLPKINLDDYSVEPMDEERIQEEIGEDGDNLSSDEDGDYRVQAALEKQTSQPLFVLPLYSLLAPEKQAKVFQPPPEGTRLCVVATNVAETSLTIPNVKYIVDTGKVKTRVYDQVSGISAFLVSWTSKASANQRAGRAGRTAPGHCYRLYSSAVYNDEFLKFSAPEITRRPVDDLVLQMKAMYIDKVVNFPFPSPPDKEALKAGEKRLAMMGALYEPVRPTRFNEVKKWEWTAKITPLGRAMACFPVSPRYAKILALSNQHGLLPYTIAIVAAMTVQEVFFDNKPIPSTEQEDQMLKDRHQQWVQIKRTWAGEGHSLALGDIMVLLKAVGAAEFVGCTPWFCEQHGLRYKAVTEIRKLRTQLTNEVNLVIPDVNLFVDPKMTPPTPLQIKLLRQVILTGFTDHIARRIPMTDIKDDDKIKLKNAYQSIEVETPVFIHQSSVLHKEAPEYVVYQEIFETDKLFMRVVAAVEPEWFPVFAPHLCTFSKPLSEPVPRYDVKTDQVLCHMSSSFGRYAWPVPPVELEFPAGIEKYRWFARFLLEGYVVKAFRTNVNVLLSPPVTMIKSWAKLQPRTEIFLQALIDKKVDSHEALKKTWCSDSKYLLREYCEWLPESLHIKVSETWPPLKPTE